MNRTQSILHPLNLVLALCAPRPLGILYRVNSLILTLFLIVQKGWAIDMATLHHNDASGRPAAPYPVGQPVEVEGIVTVGANIFASTYGDLFVQDRSAGINVYSAKPWPVLIETGDSVRISGVIRHFRGLTEISELTNVSILGKQKKLPEPLPLTCNQVANSFLEDFSEPHESRLIRINQVTVVAANDQTLTIADQTGQCLLFLDTDAGLPMPQGLFDVIGVLKQYDTSAPFSEGYEITPRFANDIIPRTGPLFIAAPMETEITPSSVTFRWFTSHPASSVFKYKSRSSWLWQNYGDSTLTQEHLLTVPDLTSATVYDGYAVSTDANGTTSSSRFSFSTSSALSSGAIQLWFNQSVQADLAKPDSAHGMVNLADKLIELIDRSRFSLDVCFYSLTHVGIVDAIGRAQKRGVSVRVIYEMDNGHAEITRLIQTFGVPVINDRFGNNSGDGAMHHKFAIIDFRDQSSRLDDYLWVGSANATYSGAMLNAENALCIQDETLCAAYTIEFDEMWGDADYIPDPSQSRFGSRKTDNTPHRFSVKGRWIEQYMSPSDNPEAAIIHTIDQAQQSLYFCIYAFTNSSIARAMQARFYSVAGFGLAGVFDAEAGIEPNSMYAGFSGKGSTAWSPAADVWLDVVPQLLHHKYMIVDAGGMDPVVITGSYNWSYSANTRNDENILILHDRSLANLYLQEFKARYQDAGGNATLRSIVTDEQLSAEPLHWCLSTCYPNPFNQSTRICVQGPEELSSDLRITIHDLLGRLIAVLSVSPGKSEVVWNGRDERDQPVASGMYFARLQSSPLVLKMLLLR